MKTNTTKCLTILVLCVFTFFSSYQDIHAYQKPLEQYYKGRDTARSEDIGYGALASGLLVGFTVPCFTYLTARMAHDGFNKSNAAGTFGGIASITFFTWGGSAFSQSRKITIPEKYLVNLDTYERQEFEKGYRDGELELRSQKYVKGYLIGLGVNALAALILLGAIIISFPNYSD